MIVELSATFPHRRALLDECSRAFAEICGDTQARKSLFGFDFDLGFTQECRSAGELQTSCTASGALLAMRRAMVIASSTT